MKKIFEPGEIIECINTGVNDFHIKATTALKLGGHYKVKRLLQCTLQYYTVYLDDYHKYNVDCEQYGYDISRFKHVDVRKERKLKLQKIIENENGLFENK